MHQTLNINCLKPINITFKKNKMAYHDQCLYVLVTIDIQLQTKNIDRQFPKRLQHGTGVIVMNSSVSRWIVRSHERIFHTTRQYYVFSLVIGCFIGSNINLLQNSTDSSFHVKYWSSSKWHSLLMLLQYRRTPASKHPKITKCIFKFLKSIHRNIS